MKHNLQGDSPAISCFFQGQGGYPYKIDEKIQGHTFLVVLPVAWGDINSCSCTVHLLERSSSDAMVGTHLRKCHGLCLYPSHQHHNCHDKPGNDWNFALARDEYVVKLSINGGNKKLKPPALFIWASIVIPLHRII